MAKNMVTRTVKSTMIEAVSVDVETMTTNCEAITIAGVYKNNDEILKKLKKLNYSNIVAIKSATIIEKLMGMTEDTFLAHAEELTEEAEKRAQYKAKKGE